MPVWATQQDPVSNKTKQIKTKKERSKIEGIFIGREARD
jgi:hypothetical protein